MERDARVQAALVAAAPLLPPRERLCLPPLQLPLLLPPLLLLLLRQLLLLQALVRMQVCLWPMLLQLLLLLHQLLLQTEVQAPLQVACLTTADWGAKGITGATGTRARWRSHRRTQCTHTATPTVMGRGKGTIRTAAVCVPAVLL